ncbi:MAG: hypothetical protein ACREUU_09685, partial [Gammaproteobacteria bacterium]
IYTWDQAGVYAYTKPGNDRVDALCFAFAPSKEFQFVPHNPFPGAFQVGQQMLDGTATKRELLAAGFKADPDIPTCLEIDVAGVNLLASLDEDTKSKLIAVDINFDD